MDKNGEGIISSSNIGGPRFGYGELVINEPFNSYRNCGSWANGNVFPINIECGKNLLTNKSDDYDKWFTISELEVWEVVNAENIKVFKEERKR